MNVKKCVALLLSGMLFAGSLSACNRTIIEHQFHTNTEYVTEVIEAESSSSDTLKRMESLLSEHGIGLNINVGTSYATPDLNSDLLSTTIDQNEFSQWVKTANAGKSPFYVYKEYTGEEFNLHEYINIWLELVDMYYDALEALTDEEWEKLSSVCGESAGVVIGGHFGVDADELDKFYIIGSWQITYTFQP